MSDHRTRATRVAVALSLLMGLLALEISTPVPAAASTATSDRVSRWGSLVAMQYSSEFGKVSNGGTYTAFASMRANLPPSDTTPGGLNYEVAVRVRQSGSPNYTIHASKTPSGGYSNGGSMPLDITPDGRFVLFVSNATDLVAGGTPPGTCRVLRPVQGPGRCILYVWDRLETVDNAISVVSLAHNGAFPDGDVNAGSISDDGSRIAFSTLATNLVPGDTNARTDIFVRDRVAGTTERVSVTSGPGGAQALGGNSGSPEISGDGDVVAFSSAATNLVADDTNLANDIFVRSLSTNITERTTTGFPGADEDEADGGSYAPALSYDGRYVAFESDATNLVPGDDNDLLDIFVTDRLAGTTERVNVDDAGIPVDDDESYNASISGDGRYVAFDSDSELLVGPTSLGGIDTNVATDVFVRDRLFGITERVSLNRNHEESYFESVQNGHISADGGYVVFDSEEGEWINENEDIDNYDFDVFLRDRGNPTSPNAPTGVVATPGNTTATVTWDAPYNGGSPITHYTVNSSPGNRNCTASTDRTCTVTGLTNGTSYTFRVRAFNAVGQSPWSAWSNAVVPGDVPSPPLNVSATAADSSANVSWQAPLSSGASAITSYVVTSSPDGQTCTWTSGPLSCTVSGLTNGTPYSFTVVAINGIGPSTPSTPSNEVTPATIPSSPLAVSALAADAGASVSWDPPLSDGGSAVTSYVVTSSPDGRTCTWTSGPLSCTVSGLTNGTPYTFTVIAINGIGSSTPSAPSNEVTPEGGSTPTGPTVSIGDASILEGDGGKQRVLRFAVTLSEPATDIVTVDWAVDDLTATGGPKPVPGVDHRNTGRAKTLRFRPSLKTGLTPVRAFVSVPVYPDTEVEGEETFAVRLADATGGYELGDPTGIGTIIDDDPPGPASLGIGDVTVHEGDVGTRVVSVPVTLSQPLSEAIRVDYVIVGTSATCQKTKVPLPGVDCNDLGGKTKSIQFKPGATGKTVKVIVFADDVAEGDEEVEVVLSNLRPTDPGSSLVVPISKAVGLVTILDDD
jgi:hypothetical protein